MKRGRGKRAVLRIASVCVLLAFAGLSQDTKGRATILQQDILGYGKTPGIDIEADAPWMVDSLSKDIPILVCIKDAIGADAITLKSINVIDSGSGLPIASQDYVWPDQYIDQSPFTYVFSGITATSLGISIGMFLNIRVEVAYVKYTEIGQQVDATYKKSLAVFISEPMPHLTNWYAGDTHFHSDFTDDYYEWGNGLIKGHWYSGQAVVGRMCRALGLDWVTITDHSCDFPSPEQWNEMSQLCDNESSPNLILIPAEEVTSSHDESDIVHDNDRVHLLAYGISSFIEGPEVFQLARLRDISESLSSIESSHYKAFSFGAHPFDDAEMILGELIETDWYDSAYASALMFASFRGYEFWNTRIKRENGQDLIEDGIDPFQQAPWQEKPNWDEDLINGIQKWDSLLSENLGNPIRRKIFIEGGSDAHGDFNYSTKSYLGLPLNTYLGTTDNAFAKVRTYIYSEDAMSKESVLDALHDGHSIVTDGPLVIFGIDKNADGSLVAGEGDIIPGGDDAIAFGTPVSFLIQWATNSAYPDTSDGSIDDIRIISGSSAGTTTDARAGSGNSLLWQVPQPVEPGTYYYRVEAYIRDDSGQIVYRAYTNPIWITWKNNPPVLSNGRVSPAWGLYYDEFNFYVDYFDPDGHAPTVKQVVVDGEAHNLILSSGTASNGTYRYYEGWMGLGPHEHYFHFEDGFGGAVTTAVSPTPSVYVILHFQTSPYDLDITFDGQIHTTPYNAYVFPGTTHTIGTYSPQGGGQTSRYIWNRWSDGLGETHEVVGPSGTVNYVCYFTSQRLLTTSANPVTGGTVSPAGSTWHDFYSTVPVTATPAPGYQFSRWSGTQTGTSNPINIYINNTYSEVANFIVVSEGVSTPSVPAGDQSLAANEMTSYTTGGSSCSYGHQVQYLFEWGDGTDSGWLATGQAETSHSWPTAGAYPVRSKARCATTPAVESAWSSELTVTVSGSTHLKVDFNGDGQEDILWRYYGEAGYVRAWFLVNSGGAEITPSADPVLMRNLGSSPEGGPSIARDASFSGQMRINAVAQKKKLLAPKMSTLMGRRSGRQIRTARVDDPRKAGGKTQMTAVRMLSDPRQTVQSPLKGTLLANSVPISAAPMIQGGADVMPVGDMNWYIVGTGHFNDDNHVDLLWRNLSTGVNIVWFMNGAEWIGSAELIPVADLNWQIVGTGDFNNDMHADILWRNSSSGENVIWYMDGVSWIGSAGLLGVSDPNWQIVGTGDFNNDTHVDILWRYNGPGGYNVVWYMENTNWIGSAELISVGDPTWQIAGTGDYDSDGNLDILWRYNGAGGHNYIWYMNGASWAAGGDLVPVSDLNWKIVSK